MSKTTPPENDNTPREDKPATSQRRWLHHLANATDVVAPLVARQAPSLEETAQDWRSRLAFVFGIVSILFAVIQFIMSFFDLIWRPLAVLITTPLYFVPPLLVISALLAFYASRRAPNARQRSQAAGAGILIVAVGLIWGGWYTYESFRPPHGILIEVGEFDGQSATKRVDFARRIDTSLKAELQDVGADIQVKRTLEVYPDAESARAYALRHQASLIIWGWYDDAGVSPHVEVLHLPTLTQEALHIPVLYATASASSSNSPAAIPQQPTLRNVALLTQAPAVMPELQLFADYGPEQMASIATTIVGMGFYINGDLDHALALLNKALASAQNDKSHLQPGLEVIYFQRAVILFRQHKIADAIADLKHALERKPDFYEAHYSLATFYLSDCPQNNQLAQVLTEAETAVKLKPNEAAAHRLLGALYLQTNAYDKAIAELQVALQHDPNVAKTYALLAMAYADNRQMSDAHSAQARAVALGERAVADPAQASGDNYLALGDAYIANGQYDKALTAYQAAQSLAPDNPRVQRGLGSANYWLGKFDLAAKAYQTWIQMAPTDDAAHLLLGLLYTEQGKTAPALAEFKQAAQLTRCDPTAHLLLGNQYWLQKDLAMAETEYRAALTLEPDNADVLYMLGVTTQLQNKLDQAAQALTKALDARPNFAQARYALGTVYFNQGRYQEAAAQREKLIATAPDNASYYMALAFAYERLARWDYAVAAYQKALALQDNSDGHLYLGLIYARRQDDTKAVTEFQKALALDSQNALASSALGELYTRLGKVTDAIAAYKHFLSLEEATTVANRMTPQNLVYVRLLLGNLEIQVGQLDEAAAQYNRVLAVQPNNPQSYIGLSEVEYKRCNLDKAVAEVKSALALTTTVSFYWNQLGLLYAAQGHRAEADQIYTTLQKTPATDFLAHLVSGNYWATIDQLDAAAHEYQLVVNAPMVPALLGGFARNGLGQLYFAKADLVSARNAYTQALTVFPSHAEAQLNLGDVLLSTGDAKTALGMYDKASAMLPAYQQIVGVDNAALLAVYLQLRRGLALRRLDQPQAADTALAEALRQAQSQVQQTPKWSFANFALALVYAAQKNATKAEQSFTTATTCDQSLRETRKLVEARLTQLQGKAAK